MTQLLRLPANTAGRDLVVGDMHGCYDDLQELLALAGFDATRDRLFAVGDLIDRGTKSAECIRLLEQPWFHSVMGNHEAMMIEAMADYGNWDKFSTQAAMWFSNGGNWALGHVKNELYDLTALIWNLPMCIVVGDGPGMFGLLHAEYHQTGSELLQGDYDEQDVMSMLWGRDILSKSHRRKPPEIAFPVYVGHSIVTGITEIGPFRYIDTGSFLASYGRGCLTMVEPATGAAWSAQTADALDWEDA